MAVQGHKVELNYSARVGRARQRDRVADDAAAIREVIERRASTARHCTGQYAPRQRIYLVDKAGAPPIVGDLHGQPRQRHHRQWSRPGGVRPGLPPSATNILRRSRLARLVQAAQPGLSRIGHAFRKDYIGTA